MTWSSPGNLNHAYLRESWGEGTSVSGGAARRQGQLVTGQTAGARVASWEAW